jgi:segregation and condensation protein A
MAFSVALEHFNGPLDLMLHLIKEKKLDLFNLDLDVLVDQYIDFIHAMEAAQLEIASEYLAELANLVEYKSKRCLPIAEPTLEADPYQKDTKDDLVHRLLEYQKFKDISHALNSRYTERMAQMDKPADSLLLDPDFEGTMVYDSDVYDLIRAMQRVVSRFKISHPQQARILKTEISLELRIEQLRQRLSVHQNHYDLEFMMADVADLNHFIVTFLAVLELIRQGDLLIDHITESSVYFTLGGVHGKSA